LRAGWGLREHAGDVFLDDDVKVCAAESERTDAGAPDGMTV